MGFLFEKKQARGLFWLVRRSSKERKLRLESSSLGSDRVKKNSGFEGGCFGNEDCRRVNLPNKPKPKPKPKGQSSSPPPSVFHLVISSYFPLVPPISPPSPRLSIRSDLRSSLPDPTEHWAYARRNKEGIPLGVWFRKETRKKMDPMDIVGKSKEDVSLPKCKNQLHLVLNFKKESNQVKSIQI